MIKKQTRLNGQVGDTIIEVLLAATILGFVIVGAAAAINHNILIMEDRQEHAQAIKLVESQIEDLRSLSTGGETTGFCFKNILNPANGEITSVTAIGDPNTPQPSNPCIVENNGTQALLGVVPAYHLSITAAGSPYTTYTISAKWAGAQGVADQVSMEYRTQ